MEGSGGFGGRERSGFSGRGGKFSRGGGKPKGKTVCKFFVKGKCTHDHCSFLHMYSPIDNITLQASVSISPEALRDISLFKIEEDIHIATSDVKGEIQVFSPAKNEVIERFTPEGETTCLRVFDQFQNVLVAGYSKQAPGGAIHGSLLLLSGENKLEVEAHEGHITDIICVSFQTPEFTGEVFFTAGLDCKIRAWKINEGQLELMHTLDTPNNSPITCLENSGPNFVFAGCQDGGIVAWNVLKNDSDIMKQDGATGIIKTKVFENHLIVARENKSVEVYDMNSEFLCTNNFTAKGEITCLAVAVDALG